MTVGANLTAVAADATQVALVQGVGVDVAGGGVIQRTVDFFAAQDRQLPTGFVGAEQLHLRHSGLGAQVLGVQLGRIADEIHRQLATWRQQWVFAETAGRVVEKLTTGQGQRTHLRGAIRGGIQRR